MGMELLADTPGCRNGNCPTVWVTERGTIVVQGYTVAPHTVRVPADLIDRAAQQLASGGRAGAGLPAPRDPEVALSRGVDGWIEVTGPLRDVACPVGEQAVEVPAAVVLAEAAAAVVAPAVRELA